MRVRGSKKAPYEGAFLLITLREGGDLDGEAFEVSPTLDQTTDPRGYLSGTAAV